MGPGREDDADARALPRDVLHWNAADDQETFLAKLLHDTWPPNTYTQVDWRYDHLTAVPASYVVCARDRALPPAWQQRFAAQLGVERVLHIDAGHQVMNTHPEVLAEVLLAECRQ